MGVHNLIKPGEVRNPYGRAGKSGMGGKTAKTLKDLLESKLNEIDEETGKSAAEIIIEQLIRQAKRGDGKFIELAFDRTLGKAPQYIENNVTGNGLGVVILPNKEEIQEIQEIQVNGENEWVT